MAIDVERMLRAHLREELDVPTVGLAAGTYGRLRRRRRRRLAVSSTAAGISLLVVGFAVLQPDVHQSPPGGSTSASTPTRTAPTTSAAPRTHAALGTTPPIPRPSSGTQPAAGVRSRAAAAPTTTPGDHSSPTHVAASQAVLDDWAQQLAKAGGGYVGERVDNPSHSLTVTWSGKPTAHVMALIDQARTEGVLIYLRVVTWTRVELTQLVQRILDDHALVTQLQITGVGVEGEGIGVGVDVGHLTKGIVERLRKIGGSIPVYVEQGNPQQY